MRDQLERDGFVILKDVLSAAERARLIETLQPWEDAVRMGRNNFEGERSRRVYSLAGKGFLWLAEHPSITAILDQMLLPNWLLSTMQSIRLYPGETEQPWHTDDIFYLVDRPHSTLAVSVIWAIEDFTDENGATELIPGSHRWGKEHPDHSQTAPIKAIMPAGSALVFDGGLWHRGGANHSGKTRLCISPQYCQPWLRTQESQLLIVPPQEAQHCTPRARAMLGYSIHPPFIGQVDGMHPLRLVDPDYNGKENPAATIAGKTLERPTPMSTNDVKELYGK